MKVINSRLGLLAGIGFLAVASVLAPQAARASATHTRADAPVYAEGLSQQPGSAGASRLGGPIVPLDQQAVSPRLSLPGCSRQDGFNGNVHWDNQTLFTLPDIYAWGQVWDVCGTNAQVFMSWYSPTYHDPNIGSSGYYHTSGVLWPSSNPDYLASNAGHIKVTVCAWWQNQWRCGTPWSVNG